MDKKIKFPKRERKRLEKAIEAIREIQRRGFDCYDLQKIGIRALSDLIEFDEAPPTVTYNFRSNDPWNNW